MSQWKGVFPAVTTKMTQDGKIDAAAMQSSLDRLVRNGVSGVIVLPMLGENASLSLSERETVIRLAREAVAGRVPVLSGLAEITLETAKAHAAAYRSFGAEGLMVFPSLGYKTDPRETAHWYREIARAGLPIMIYNNPVDYKTLVTLDMWEELLEACSNIQAVKESTRDVTNVTRMINRFGSRLRILCGVDTLAVEEMLLGADGWVAGLVCAFPAETVAIYRLVKAGRIEEALAIYRWFMPVLELDIVPKLVQYIKLAEVQTGIGSEYVRAPRLPLVGKERERILGIIGDCVASRPALPDYLSILPEKNFA